MFVGTNTCEKCGNLFTGSVCPACGSSINSGVQPIKLTSSSARTDYVCHNCCSSNLHIRAIKGLGVFMFSCMGCVGMCYRMVYLRLFGRCDWIFHWVSYGCYIVASAIDKVYSDCNLFGLWC